MGIEYTYVGRYASLRLAGAVFERGVPRTLPAGSYAAERAARHSAIRVRQARPELDYDADQADQEPGYDAGQADQEPDYDTDQADQEPDAANGDGDGEPTAAQVRAWARSVGIEVPSRGKLPPDVMQAYRNVH